MTSYYAKINIEKFHRCSVILHFDNHLKFSLYLNIIINLQNWARNRFIFQVRILLTGLRKQKWRWDVPFLFYFVNKTTIRKWVIIDANVRLSEMRQRKKDREKERNQNKYVLLLKCNLSRTPFLLPMRKVQCECN